MVDSQVNITDVEVTLGQSRVLHFSDGIEEEVVENHATALEKLHGHHNVPVDPKTLSWGPWLSHQASQSGTKILNAIDYAGEGLANFFGITTPKYQLEIEEYEKIQEEKKQIDEEYAGWVPKDGQIPLVLDPPSQAVERPSQV